MIQENLFVAPALCTGFTFKWSIDRTHPDELGLVVVDLQWSKRPAGGTGGWTQSIEKDEHELLPTLAERLCGEWDWPDAQRRIPHSLQGAYRQYQDHYHQKRPRSA